MKILVDFFDEENMNNCISQLFFEYDKICYLYFERHRSSPEVGPVLDALDTFNNKRLGIQTEDIGIRVESVDSVLRAIEGIYNEEDEFDFDVTGGPELFGLAVGAFVADKSKTNIKVHSFNIPDRCYRILYPKHKIENLSIARPMGVREFIGLRAADINTKTIKKPYKPCLSNNNWRENIIKIWNCVKDDYAAWNTFCVLSDESKKIISINEYKEKNEVIKVFESKKAEEFGRILRKLHKAGIINLLLLTERSARYSVNLPKDQIDMLETGGRILEMYVYNAAQISGKFHDCCVGVNLDWDGDIVENDTDQVTNEVDVILSNGYLPIFISCKNTTIERENLYEIEIMAKGYGGKYAKAVIVSTVEAPEAIRRRAEASGITIIDNVPRMSPEQLGNRLAKI